MSEIQENAAEKRVRKKLVQVQVGLSDDIRTVLQEKCAELRQTEAALVRMLVMKGLREMGAIS
ncbi:hypothetical protein [Aggregatibacter sp. 2125159857]|uniref:hypothetical protein n=1 Tax=Aggregatibacter sp. 2125159857 TaxID=2820817 RepID=UPI001AE05533|nr:hypothetical protein [Aggregatibacter sp. 2125159857]QTO01701.1 hypothetical protein J5X96_01330 [Aggregatibacter sp. 2125159857]